MSQITTAQAKRPRRHKGGICTLAAMTALAFSAAPANAVIIDAAGDFLGTYTGIQNGDLDVLWVDARLTSTDVTLSALMNAPIGTTSSAVYVWGVNRGAGTPGLLGGSPPLGSGVLFDAVVILLPNLTGRVVAFNAVGPPTATVLAGGAVTSNGGRINAVVPLSLLPTRGFAPAAYLYNLWPRAGLGSNTQISDFAPDNSSFVATIPEPGAWALMIAGFGLAGGMLRRRRPILAT